MNREEIITKMIEDNKCLFCKYRMYLIECIRYHTGPCEKCMLKENNFKLHEDFDKVVDWIEDLETYKETHNANLTFIEDDFEDFPILNESEFFK